MMKLESKHPSQTYLFCNPSTAAIQEMIVNINSAYFVVQDTTPTYTDTRETEVVGDIIKEYDRKFINY